MLILFFIFLVKLLKVWLLKKWYVHLFWDEGTMSNLKLSTLDLERNYPPLPWITWPLYHSVYQNCWRLGVWSDTDPSDGTVAFVSPVRACTSRPCHTPTPAFRAPTRGLLTPPLASQAHPVCNTRSTFEISRYNTCNIRLKIDETLENHYKYTQHLDRILATYVWNI